MRISFKSKQTVAPVDTSQSGNSLQHGSPSQNDNVTDPLIERSASALADHLDAEATSCRHCGCELEVCGCDPDMPEVKPLSGAWVQGAAYSLAIGGVVYGI